MFKKYVSNVACGTGANYLLEFGESRTFRARAYFKPDVCGSYNWRFFFSNTVDSTFADGTVAYRNKSGGNWKIRSASIADGGEISDRAVESGKGMSRTPVTFDGRPDRSVAPDERFWSDEIPFAVPENHYLVWEWELEGDRIPCTPDSQVPTFTDFGDGYDFRMECPMPALLGCDRSVKKTVAFMGDSITQGCATTNNAYEMWAAQISKMLNPTYAVWNLGLGWGRGADAATDGAWLNKGKQMDVVVLTYGVNDILHGSYGSDHRSTAGEVTAVLESLIEKLQASGTEVILSTVPPFDFSPEEYREWRAVNMAIPYIAKLHGCRVFDLESSLDASFALGNKPMYGPHPNGNGGRAAAERFYATFHTDSGWTI
ncbi:MAG: SGNH/GDSL hydrolase family protein [Eubacteriales bacterium]